MSYTFDVIFIKNIAWDKDGNPRNNHWVEQQLCVRSIVNGERWVDFIGRFENLQEDWKIVCKNIGIDEKLPHTNKNNNRPYRLGYRSFYNDETKQIVAEKFKNDIAIFGYEF